LNPLERLYPSIEPSELLLKLGDDSVLLARRRYRYEKVAQTRELDTGNRRS